MYKDEYNKYTAALDAYERTSLHAMRESVNRWADDWNRKRKIVWFCFAGLNFAVFYSALYYIKVWYYNPKACVRPMKQMLLPFKETGYWGVIAIIFLYILFAGMFAIGSRITEREKKEHAYVLFMYTFCLFPLLVFFKNFIVWDQWKSSNSDVGGKET